jgi:predicted nuclease of predicted toxin-antitoxin system
MNLVQSKWIESGTKGSPPSVRWLHSANVVNNKIFCFGGSAGTGHFLNDLHIFTIGWFP